MAIIPNVADGDVSSQTVNTPGPCVLLFDRGTRLFGILLWGEQFAFFGNVNGE